MKKLFFPLAISMSMLVLVTDCNDPTVIGIELLEQDEADLRFVDTLTLRAQTVKEDSVLTYNVDKQYNSFPCGYFEDPIFGKVRSEIYGQFQEGPLEPPAFENPVFDSLVLTIGFDTSRIYGRFNENQQLEVRRIIEDLDNTESFYSNQSFATSMDVLGAIDFTPDPFALKSYVNVPNLDTITGSFISIRLDEQLGMDMLNEDWYEEGEFVKMLKGLHLKVANTTATEGMMSLDMNSTFTRLRLYYRNFTSEPDTISVVYDFEITGSINPIHAHMVHDFTGAPVEAYFNDPSAGDSLMFMQGMAGPNVAIEIPHLQDLGDIVVNKAEMDFFVATLNEDEASIYTPSEQLVLAFKNNEEDGFFLLDDVVLSPSAFGGVLEEETIDGQNVQKFTVNIAAYLNRKILAGDVSEVKVFLRAFPKQETINRVILYGPQHTQYPAKLRLTYTDINN